MAFGPLKLVVPGISLANMAGRSIVVKLIAIVRVLHRLDARNFSLELWTIRVLNNLWRRAWYGRWAKDWPMLVIQTVTDH